jgi:ATP-dependent Clp protease adaptor protein ClpS
VSDSDRDAAARLISTGGTLLGGNVFDAKEPVVKEPGPARKPKVPKVANPKAAKEPQKDNGDDGGGRGNGTAVITRTRTQTRRPGMYRVLLLNDDYTPMEFVVAVLRKYFSKGPEEATRIMLHVHQHGVGECGVFTYEVAETKVTQVMDYARKHQHPLQCIMEKK